MERWQQRSSEPLVGGRAGGESSRQRRLAGGQSGGGPGLELVGRAGPLLGWPGRSGRRHRAGTRARAGGAGPGTRTIHTIGNGYKLF